MNTPVCNPLKGEDCISYYEYMAIFHHGLGPDCLEGTADDVARSADYCPPNFEYNTDLCECVQSEKCYHRCKPTEFNNPLKCGECLSERDYVALY